MNIFTEEEKSELNRQLLPPTVKIIETALERVYNLSIEKTLCNLPDLLVHLSRRTEGLQKLYTDFFTSHPELAKDKETVAEVIQSLELHNPGDTPAQLLEKVPAAYAAYKAAKVVVKTNDIDLAAIDQNINGVL